MVLNDDDPEKWMLKKHTQVKHTLLEKYLTPWTYKLGSRHNMLLYIDGFAGRGEYFDYDGNVVGVGSPIIAMRKAQDLLTWAKENNRELSEFWCLFIEKNEQNYQNLVEVIEREKEKCPLPHIIHCNGDFADEITKFLNNAQRCLPPTLCFIDPFGFDVPFPVIRALMTIPKTEVLFTFMSRDINRFLSSPKHEKSLNTLFGTTEWKKYNLSSLSPYERESNLVNLYRKQLHEEAGVKYSMPFMVKMPESRQTVYYIIHATNSFDGFKIMKDIMAGQSSGEVFGYMGPEDGQTSLGCFDKTPLRNYLLKKYRGQEVSFERIIYDSYADEEVIRFVEKEYRRVLKSLITEGAIRSRPVTSKTPRGLSGKDILIFPS